MGFERNRSYKWILLPIETKVREFHAKVLLACVAAEAGFCVVLWTLDESKKQRWLQLPRGICLEKSIVKANAKKFNLLRKSGNRVCAWCEEGLVLLNQKEYQQRRVFEESVAQVDYFFAWGDYQANAIIEKVPSIKERMCVYGNPRIDILRREFRSIFDDEAEVLKKRFGDFILVNTNFSLCNHLKGTDAVIKIFRRSGKITTQEQETFYNGWITFKAKLYQDFILMIRALSRVYSNFKIIIRPHPSENFESWKQVAANLNNVHVIHKDNAIPWLMAAKVIIHNGCTTGLEAYLLDRPVIAYQPVTSFEYDFYLPNAVSRKATSIENLIGIINTIFSQDTDRIVNENRKIRQTVAPYLRGLEGVFSSDRIVGALKQIDVESQPFTPSASRRIAQILQSIMPSIKFKFRDIKDRMVIVKNAQEKYQPQTLHNIQKRYAEQKFPGMSLEEVKQTISKMQYASGRFTSVNAEKIGQNCFVIGAWD